MFALSKKGRPLAVGGAGLAEISGRRTHDMTPSCRLEVIGGAPHGMGWTHADEVNKILVNFLAE